MGVEGRSVVARDEDGSEEEDVQGQETRHRDSDQ